MHQYVVKECLFCKSESKETALYEKNFRDEDLTPAIFSARRVTEHWHYRMVRCETCGLVFSKETLPDTALFDFYNESTVTFSEHTAVLRRDYWKPLQRYHRQLEKGAALEIGCSSGFFLEELVDRGIGEVWGFEPSKHAKELAAEQVRESIHGSFFEGAKSVSGKKFDLVCSFQTLDHLSEPLQFLEKCREVVKPGGLVYMVTHNVDSLQAKLLGEKSPIVDVEHIYLFNRKTLPRVLETAGFEVLESNDFRNSYPLRYWVRMLPMGAGLKRFAQATLDTVKLSTFSPSLAAGNIYAIGRMPL